MEKLGDSKITILYTILILVISISFVIAAVSVNNKINNTLINETEKPKLATVVNGKSIFDDSYTKIYLSHYNNFSDVNFREIKDGSIISALMKVGNFNHKHEGFIINNKKYVFDLIACDRETESCEFRINGMRTGKIHLDVDKGPVNFNINGEYKVKVNSIRYHICDPDLPVCDKRYEAYDLVNVSIVP